MKRHHTHIQSLNTFQYSQILLTSNSIKVHKFKSNSTLWIDRTEQNLSTFILATTLLESERPHLRKPTRQNRQMHVFTIFKNFILATTPLKRLEIQTTSRRKAASAKANKAEPPDARVHNVQKFHSRHYAAQKA